MLGIFQHEGLPGLVEHPGELEIRRKLAIHRSDRAIELGLRLGRTVRGPGEAKAGRGGGQGEHDERDHGGHAAIVPSGVATPLRPPRRIVSTHRTQHLYAPCVY